MMLLKRRRRVGASDERNAKVENKAVSTEVSMPESTTIMPCAWRWGRCAENTVMEEMARKGFTRIADLRGDGQQCPRLQAYFMFDKFKPLWLG